MTRWIGILLFGLLGGATLGADAPQTTSQPPFRVGYRILDFKNPKDGTAPALTVAVWYPTEAPSKPHRYGGGSTVGQVALNAAPRVEDAPWPLLVFSHGYGGSGLGAVFFTEALAARGWIVACPDHHDPDSAVRIRTGQEKDLDRLALLRHAREITASSPEDRDKYLYRLDEMQLALDGLLASDPFGKLIDRDRMAVGGHSLGGFTALGLCGTIPERRDSRLRAVLLFSTGAGAYLFRDQELAAVRMPSMIFMGEREKEQRRGDQTMSDLSARIYRNLAAPKYFLEVKGASHFSFNNRFENNARTRLLSGTETQFEVIRRYAIAFLEKHVAGRKTADRVLESSDPQLTRSTAEP